MLGPNELDRAYRQWLLLYKGLEIDCELPPFIVANVRRNWLRSAREALMLSAEAVAKNLNVSRAALTKIEQSEEETTINIATLIKVASAMDCELVYAIRPKTKQKFSELIWKQLLSRALMNPRVQSLPREHKPRALALAAALLLEDTHFRKEMGWLQKRPKISRRSRGH